MFKSDLQFLITTSPVFKHSGTSFIQTYRRKSCLYNKNSLIPLSIILRARCLMYKQIDSVASIQTADDLRYEFVESTTS